MKHRRNFRRGRKVHKRRVSAFRASSNVFAKRVGIRL